jgi:hypothetical protein
MGIGEHKNLMKWQLDFFCRDLNMVEHGIDQISSYWKIIFEKEKLSWEALKISLGIDELKFFIGWLKEDYD